MDQFFTSIKRELKPVTILREVIILNVVKKLFM
jgi:hypothetical protein